MKVEFLVSIKHPDDSEPMFLDEEQAKEVYDQLHARFGDFDQARELSQLARESVARELRLAELESLVRALKTEYVHVGPTLEDDIEAMIAARGEKPAENPWDLVIGIVPESESREVDDADEQEAEFLSRLPKLKHSLETVDCEHCGSALDDTSAGVLCASCAPSNTPERPAEPESAPEPTAPSNDRQVQQRIPETAEEKAFRLWHQYRERHPEMPENRIVSRITAHYQGDRPSTDEVRGWLRARGVDLPEPLTRAQVAERMRATRLAAAGERVEPPKAEPPHVSKPEALSVDAFNPPAGLEWQDQLALTFEVLDNPAPEVSSLLVARGGLDAVEAYCNFVAKMRPAYKAMPPFKRTEFKEALSAKLRGKVAA